LLLSADLEMIWSLRGTDQIIQERWRRKGWNARCSSPRYERRRSRSAIWM